MGQPRAAQKVARELLKPVSRDYLGFEKYHKLWTLQIPNGGKLKGTVAVAMNLYQLLPVTSQEYFLSAALENNDL